MKGISVWMFSKIVMLVFLIMTFSIVLGFLKLTNEKVSADSAEALAMQIKDSIKATLHTNTISSQAVVPIPKTIPESGAGEGKLKSYTVTVGSSDSADGEVIYAAIGWGENPESYVAASSFLTGPVTIEPSNGLSFNSQDYHYFVVKKEDGKLCFRACESGGDFESSDNCIGCLP